MNNIPLVRVRYANSFAQALNELGAPTSRLMDQVRLSEDLLSIPHGIMPVNQLWQFTALSSHYTGIPDFGLRAGLVPLASHSQFGHGLLSAPNLYQAMKQFCYQARSELSNADFQIRQKDGETWFCGGSVEGTAEEVQQVELYRIGMMVQVIRWAAGDNWQITELELQSQNGMSLRDTTLIRHANVKFGCSMAAIKVPEFLLTTPLYETSEAIKEAPEADSRIADNLVERDFKASVKEIIQTQVLMHNATIEQLAISLQLPARTLQRYLANNGTSFKQLLDQARIEIAQRMLQDKTVKLQQIATELGYSEHSHFTRAFKRIMGITPQNYRNLNIHIDSR